MTLFYSAYIDKDNDMQIDFHSTVDEALDSCVKYPNYIVGGIKLRINGDKIEYSRIVKGKLEWATL